MSYSGVWTPHVGLILRLWREGRSPAEIAALVPPVGRPWLRPERREPLTTQMVNYILLREVGAGPPARVPSAWSERQLKGFAEFRRRYEAWEHGRTSGRVAVSFEAYARGLYEVLGWLVGELEARRSA